MAPRPEDRSMINHHYSAPDEFLDGIFIETFRALGVARGHSSYKLTKLVSFHSSVRKSSCQVHWRLVIMFIWSIYRAMLVWKNKFSHISYQWRKRAQHSLQAYYHFESFAENIKKIYAESPAEVDQSGTPVRRTYHDTRWASTYSFGVILWLCVRMAPMNVSSNALVSFLNSESKIGPKAPITTR